MNWSALSPRRSRRSRTPGAGGSLVPAAVFVLRSTRSRNLPAALRLTERRDSTARPFKCPHEVYRAVITAVAGSAGPQTFQQIKGATERSLKETIADYGVRTPLRFWAVLGLVRHEQARFTRTGTKAAFTRATRDAWSRARHERIEIEPG